MKYLIDSRFTKFNPNYFHVNVDPMKLFIFTCNLHLSRNFSLIDPDPIKGICLMSYLNDIHKISHNYCYQVIIAISKKTEISNFHECQFEIKTPEKIAMKPLRICLYI